MGRTLGLGIGGIQAMPGFLTVFGYKDPRSPTGWNLTPGRQQLISSLMTLGAVIASGCAGPLAWKLGRKSCLWLACLICAVSNAIQMGTTSIGALYFGRLLLGIANGMLMTFSQLYIQEICPARYRGLALAGFQTWTSVGTLIGTIVDNFTAPIDGRNAYLIPLGLIFVVPFFISLGLFIVPESPRWLAEKGKNDSAAEAMRWLRPSAEAASAELLDVQEALAQEKSMSESVSFLDIFKGVDRRRTIISIAAVNTQAASGAMFIIAYGTYFFQMAGVGKPFANACILVGVGVAAILVNSCLVTKYGRRRVFLLTGLLLCGLFQLIIAAIYTASPDSQSAKKALVGLTVLYIVSYNGMIATYAWVLGGEIPSQRLRSYTFGLAASIGFFGAWLATFTAPYFINPASLNWGPKYGYIWAPSCVIAAVFVYFYIPEVKDRTLEEITEMFEARVPARKFRSYKSTREVAAEKVDKSSIEMIEDIDGDRKAAAIHVTSVT